MSGNFKKSLEQLKADYKKMTKETTNNTNKEKENKNNGKDSNGNKNN